MGIMFTRAIAQTNTQQSHSQVQAQPGFDHLKESQVDSKRIVG